MKIFLDTNVLVSGFATRGLSADVMRLVMAEHELVTGEVVLKELRRVLLEKFKMTRGAVDDLEALLRRYHVEPQPPSVPAIEIRDSDDAWVLGSALAAHADLLITGDKDLLDIAEQVADLRILDPRGFWELMRQA